MAKRKTNIEVAPLTIEEWKEIYGKTPSPPTETAEQSIARAVLESLPGSFPVPQWKVQTLANAMVAYHELMKESGL
jgi:hypothetical protein